MPVTSPATGLRRVRAPCCCQVAAHGGARTPPESRAAYCDQPARLSARRGCGSPRPVAKEKKRKKTWARKARERRPVSSRRSSDEQWPSRPAAAIRNRNRRETLDPCPSRRGRSAVILPRAIGVGFGAWDTVALHVSGCCSKKHGLARHSAGVVNRLTC